MDPQLHSHAVVAAKVASPDGRWLALDARPLMVDQTVQSGLYHAGLRSELTRRLGVDWEVPVNGIAEMTGIDQEVLQEFSRRPRQVDARLEVKLDRFREGFAREPTGRERWRLEREAVVDSRRAKPAAGDATELRAAWRERLEGHGTDTERLVTALLGRVVEPCQDLVSDPWSPMADTALAALTESRSTWRHPDVVRELARTVPTDTGMPAVELVAAAEHAAGVFAEEWLIELARPVPEGGWVRASDGRPVIESPLERRYTTAYILEQEQHPTRNASRICAGANARPSIWPGCARYGPHRAVGATRGADARSAGPAAG
jgi:hypothetical protein